MAASLSQGAGSPGEASAAARKWRDRIGDVAGLQIEFGEIVVDVAGFLLGSGQGFKDGDGLGLVVHGQEGAGQSVA